MKYYKKDDILNLIDEKFDYVFEGKEKDDHLISPKTWNKYFNEFFQDKEDKLYSTLKHDEWDKIDLLIEEEKEKKTKSSNRHMQYREDLVDEIIEFREEKLIEQRHGNRKTTIDYHAIEVFENIAKVLGTKVDESIYEKRIPITKYRQMMNERIPTPSLEEIEEKKNQLIKVIFDQLIDEDKFNEDIFEHFTSNTFIHGYKIPLEAVEEDGKLLGFKIDAKNYLIEDIKLDL